MKLIVDWTTESSVYNLLAPTSESPASIFIHSFVIQRPSEESGRSTHVKAFFRFVTEQNQFINSKLVHLMLIMKNSRSSKCSSRDKNLHSDRF